MIVNIVSRRRSRDCVISDRNLKMLTIFQTHTHTRISYNTYIVTMTCTTATMIITIICRGLCGGMIRVTF